MTCIVGYWVITTIATFSIVISFSVVALLEPKDKPLTLHPANTTTMETIDKVLRIKAQWPTSSYVRFRVKGLGFKGLEVQRVEGFRGGV